MAPMSVWSLPTLSASIPSFVICINVARLIDLGRSAVAGHRVQYKIIPSTCHSIKESISNVFLLHSGTYMRGMYHHSIVISTSLI